MTQYIHHMRCRKKFICNYFEDQIPPGHECSDTCDNCIRHQQYRVVNIDDE